MNAKLFEENQAKFKAIFLKIANKDSLMPLASFQVFCKNLDIIPVIFI